MSTCLLLVLRLPRCAALHDASVGLAVVMWSCPRGGKLDKAGETVLDVCAYAAHMAALLGAHIIKGRRPTCCGSPRPRPPPSLSWIRQRIGRGLPGTQSRHVMAPSSAR